MGYLSGYDDDMGTVLAHVRAERFRQEDLRKSGKFSHTCATQGANNDRCNTILGEEVGEAAKALNDGDIPGLRAELIQVAAVAVAWVERLDAEALAVQRRWDAVMAKPFAAPVVVKRATVAIADRSSPDWAQKTMAAGSIHLTDEQVRVIQTCAPGHGAAVTEAILAEAAERQAQAQARQLAPEKAAEPPFAELLAQNIAESDAIGHSKRYAALGDSYDFIESMIEERTAANPQFPEMLAEAVKRREQVHQLARDAAKVDFVTPPPPPPASLVHWSPQPGREESEAMCDPTMAAPPASAAIAEVNCPACLSLAAKIGAQASRDLQRMAIEPGSHRATAFADVAAERERQVTKGYNEEHDDSHGNGSIAAAAIAFTAAALGDGKLADAMYPFGLGFVTKRDDSPRSLLVKAAALLIAEIERRDRAAEDRGANAAEMADGESSSADTGDGEG